MFGGKIGWKENENENFFGRYLVGEREGKILVGSKCFLPGPTKMERKLSERNLIGK